MNSNSKAGKMGCLVIILILVGIVIAVIVSTNKLAGKESKISDLISKVDEYIALEGNYVESDPQKPVKYFIVQNDFGDKNSSKENVYSPVYFELPDELKANSISELNTLVQLNIYEEITGEYSNGVKAYTKHVEITVIDMVSGNVIKTTEIIGKPPQVISKKEQAHGAVNDWQITDYLKQIAGYAKN